MDFKKAFQQKRFFFYDGPMETRIEYGTGIELDPEMSIFQMMNSKEDRFVLAKFYRADIEAVKPFNVPIILNAPTFRASAEHFKRLEMPDEEEYAYAVNQACIKYVKTIRHEYPDYLENIFITAPIGPKFAGFTPDLSHDLAAEIAYHQVQINTVAQLGVDLISIAAMPGEVECMGAAIAASQTDCEYTVGFVIDKDGNLLDGTPISRMIGEIDRMTKRKPLGYIIACTHPSVAMEALKSEKPDYLRIIGIKANGSCKSPKELLKLNSAACDSPDAFADSIVKLGKPRGFKLYGGCCGTDSTHLEALVKKLTS